VSDTDRETVRRLTGPPWLLTVAEARKCIADGTAPLMLNSSAKPIGASDFATARQKVADAWNRELAGEPSRSGAAVVIDDGITEAQRENYTHSILPGITLSAPPAEPPAPAAPVAQSSEPERVCYFVCRKCNGSFAGRASELRSCECGAARYGDDGMKPFSEMRIPLCTSDAIDVTELVECGKLVVAVLSDGKAIFAVSNRNRRNVVQTFPEVLRIAQGIARGSVRPVEEYYSHAAGLGARTSFHAHYHTRSCGVETGADGETYLKKEATGDARFCGFVIARREENEADGSLIFAPVGRCARCGGDHAAPVPFWKLTRPVHEWLDADTPGRALATHFGYCPTNGEPIMMVSSEPLPAAVIDFDKPAAGGTVEPRQNMQDIGGLKPVVASAITQRRVPGVDTTKEYDDGYTAGVAGATSFSNPHPAGTPLADEWLRGLVEGRKVHGDS